MKISRMENALGSQRRTVNRRAITVPNLHVNLLPNLVIFALIGTSESAHNAQRSAAVSSLKTEFPVWHVVCILAVVCFSPIYSLDCFTKSEKEPTS
jgi:hypothetical protein